MSQIEAQQATHRGMRTRTVVLLILIVGLSAGAVAYAVASTSAALTNQSTTDLNMYNGRWLGWRGAGPLGWHQYNGTLTGFRAASTIANTSVTGFSVVDSNHLSLTLAYTGTGTSPAATIVVVAPGLSGSNMITAGWSSPTTVSVALVGSGSLSSNGLFVRVLIVPLTGS